MPRLLVTLLAFLALAAPARAASPDLVISQVYGGGGNSGAPLGADFVELYNRGDTAVSLAGTSLQYASATGTGNLGTNAAQLTELPAVDVAPGHYFVVQEAGAGLAGADLIDPTPISLAAAAGKLAFVDGTASLGCNGGSAPCDTAARARVRDLVGYGNANFFEGSGAAPAASTTTAAVRVRARCEDTDDNASDFAARPPAPRAACADPAPFVAATDPADAAGDVPLDANVRITFSEPVDVAGGAFSLSCTRSGEHAAAATSEGATYTLDPSTDFVGGERCTVTVHAAAVTDRDSDDPPDQMAADRSFAFLTIPLELRIHDIQGAQHRSPYEGGAVANVPGVVTALKTNGFFLQDPHPDGRDATSEGIFVFTAGAPTVAVGDSVTVSGRVAEFRPGATDLTTTELTSARIAPDDDHTPVMPTLIGIGGRVPPLFVISDDAAGGDVENAGTPFDPRDDGIDFHESLEGMLVRLRQPMAVGPTNSFHELPVIADGGLLGFPRTTRGGVLIRPFDFNPERFILDSEAGFDTPTAKVRDRLGDVTAVVDYSFGNFKYQLTGTPALRDGGLEREVTRAPGAKELAIASMNMENLSARSPDAKLDALAKILVENLRSPDIVAAEEIQDNDGATDTGSTDASQTWSKLIAAVSEAGGPAYDYRQIDPVNDQDGGEPGGNIRVGFLFRTDRGLAFVDHPGGTSTTPTQAAPGGGLTLSPGRVDPAHAAWANSRKPLAGEFRWRGKTLVVIANHFNSKGGDEPLFGRRQPPQRSSEVQRHQQAAVLGGFVDTLLAADRGARVAVLGDFNDFDFSQTLDILTGANRLTNLMDTLPVPERYSYVFDGNSQVLDQILVTRALGATHPAYDSVHVNAEFPDQASDHDPQIARLRLAG